MSVNPQQNQQAIEKRQHWISILSRSNATELQAFLAEFSQVPTHRTLREPETGLVMVRGRAGGSGQPFNLGEASVTRCSISLQSGEVGHAYVTGRDRTHAQLAALFDGLLQHPDWHLSIMEQVICVIENRLKTERGLRKAKVAATKVDFFTMVRGEDE